MCVSIMAVTTTHVAVLKLDIMTCGWEKASISIKASTIVLNLKLTLQLYLGGVLAQYLLLQARHAGRPSAMDLTRAGVSSGTKRNDHGISISK